MERVYLGSCPEYRVSLIKDFILEGIGGMEKEFEGARVLLKPNLLSGKSPEKAVTTHPAVVRAIAEVLRDLGAKIYIGDSPGYESCERVLRVCGLMEVVEEMGIEIAPFNKKVLVKGEGVSPYRVFTLAEDIRSYDGIINLPKLKTHVMMGLTLGVKNTFGFVPGKEKGRWHLRAGKDRFLFASVLADIHNLVKPTLTILDGIIGMDGDGPSSGRVRPFGIIAMSKNAFALDYVIEKRAGIDPPLPLSAVAIKHGLLGKYEVVDLGAPLIQGLIPARESAADWALPGFVKKILRKLLVKKPKVKEEMCRGCGVCGSMCPASAITMEQGLPRFDYRACICCYCCQEMCPEGSIRV
ncbi:MAG TPA: DUF362 domain-containing protein [Syntrophorhabdaceae bacterium]